MKKRTEMSAGEALVMKAIWDEAAKNEGKKDISFQELMDVLREQYDKDYARTTVVTFLLRLSDKGYLETYRKGKLSYAHILKTEDEYKKEIADRTAKFWFRGNVTDFLAALHDTGNLSGDSLKKAREYLDELDQ